MRIVSLSFTITGRCVSGGVSHECQSTISVNTIGGIFGTIEHMDEETAVLQVEGGGRLRVLRRAIAGKVDG